jgi:hypothetical protein
MPVPLSLSDKTPHICQTCQWWHQHHAEGHAAPWPLDSGYCRVHAPLADSSWPTSQRWEWCGEWAPITLPTTSA